MGLGFSQGPPVILDNLGQAKLQPAAHRSASRRDFDFQSYSLYNVSDTLDLNRRKYPAPSRSLFLGCLIQVSFH